MATQIGKGHSFGLRSRFVSAVVISVSFIFVVWAQVYPSGPSLWPTIVGLCVLLLGLADWFSRGRGELSRRVQAFAGAGFENPEMSHSPTIGEESSQFGWLLLLGVSVLLLGLVVTVPLFAGSYLRFRGNVKLASAVMAAFALLAAMYALFELFLGLELYRGAIVDLL